jgi:hypothetical protein
MRIERNEYYANEKDNGHFLWDGASKPRRFFNRVSYEANRLDRRTGKTPETTGKHEYIQGIS